MLWHDCNNLFFQKKTQSPLQWLRGPREHEWASYIRKPYVWPEHPAHWHHGRRDRIHSQHSVHGCIAPFHPEVKQKRKTKSWDVQKPNSSTGKRWCTCLSKKENTTLSLHNYMCLWLNIILLFFFIFIFYMFMLYFCFFVWPLITRFFFMSLLMNLSSSSASTWFILLHLQPLVWSVFAFYLLPSLRPSIHPCSS